MKIRAIKGLPPIEVVVGHRESLEEIRAFEAQVKAIPRKGLLGRIFGGMMTRWGESIAKRDRRLLERKSIIYR